MIRYDFKTVRIPLLLYVIFPANAVVVFVIIVIVVTLFE